MKELKFKGIFEEQIRNKKKLFTLNYTPGKKVYNENLIKLNGKEYREWNPEKSKLGAGILKGLKNIGFKEDSIVLYLGAASGTTVSHVSDILRDKGYVFALDFAPRVVRDLYFLALERKNLIPLLDNASDPDSYKTKITGTDFVFQDIAQRFQAEIFIKNCDMFLKKGGFGMLVIKARSIDVSKNPKLVFNEVKEKLVKHFEVQESILLEPFEKDHMLFLVKKV